MQEKKVPVFDEGLNYLGDPSVGKYRTSETMFTFPKTKFSMARVKGVIQHWRHQQISINNTYEVKENVYIYWYWDDLRRLYWHGFTLIPAWISNYNDYELYSKITYRFPNVSGTAVEVWGKIRNLMPHFIGLLSHTLLDMWLFIHAAIQVKPCQGERPMVDSSISYDEDFLFSSLRRQIVVYLDEFSTSCQCPQNDQGKCIWMFLWWEETTCVCVCVCVGCEGKTVTDGILSQRASNADCRWFQTPL